MLELKNIGIRAIELEDLALIQRWRNNEKLRKYFREYRDFSRDQLQRWYEGMIQSKDFEMFVIVDLSNNETVGVTGLTYIDWVNRHSDLHFYIGKNSEWIDEQYAPIAIKLILNYGFNNLNMNKLWVEVYEIDDKKLNFFQSIGFEIDATFRDHYYYDGKYFNSHILSLLKKDAIIG
tara:strand:- start:1902 stop:2432 length:531 start_codon:yes stop_codon:yes gene_type:complete